MDYSNFQQYPLQILAIDESYNDELISIEQSIIDEIDYSGNADDIDTVLPYFVFYKFCENRNSSVSAQSGEMAKVAEFSVPSREAMNRAWNLGVKKLLTLITLNSTDANWRYKCEINLECGFIL